MAEEITNEAIVEESPMAEAPLEVPQEESASIETTSPPDDDKFKRMQAVYKMLDSDAVYYKYVPKSFDEFITKIGSDVKYAQGIHKMVASDEVYSKYLPETFEETVQYFGLGKQSAVPSASVGGGSATKGRGVEQPSTLPQKSSEASLDNIQKTLQVYADGQGAFPETLSAADVKELRKQVPGGELPNISDDKVAKMLAGKSPKQVRIASVNAIPDIKERKTEQARMYKDFAREKSVENQQLDQNITALTQGLKQIKAEGDNLQQQLQNPNIDPQTASMLSEQLQQTQANYNQAANDYNDQLNKYQQNARFIKTMGAGALSSIKDLLPSSMFQPRSPSDVMAASAFNSTAPALLKTLGAVVDIWPSMVYGEDAKDFNSPVADALFNIADKITIDIGKYNPQANVSLMDDVNAANASQLFGSLLGSVAMTFGGGAVAGATGSQIAGFSQVYGDVYKQGRDAGLTQAESMYFALPTGIVAAYLGDKGVESLAGAFTKTSLKSAIKQGMKEMAEKKTPQMMMEFGQKVLTNTLEGSAKEGLQEGSEFATEFGSKKLASLKEGVKFQDDLSLEGFKKGLTESVIGGAAGGGLLGPFFGAGRNSAFADVVTKAARDSQAEADFMQQLDASVVAKDITPEQKQQMVEMLEKTKQAAATVPPVVESEPARAEATALVLEQQDLQEQIEQTNLAMAKPLNDRLDEVNNRLGEIAEGKNLPTEEEEAAPALTFAEAIATPEYDFFYNGEQGKLLQEGQTIVFETKDRIYDLENVDELKDKSIDELGIEQLSALDVALNDDNTLTIEGKSYVNNFSNPEAAINYDADGNVVSVNLETESGEKRAFRGQRAEEIAYQYKLKSLEQNGTDEQIDNAIEQAGQAVETERIADEATPKRKGKSVRQRRKQKAVAQAELPSLPVAEAPKAPVIETAPKTLPEVTNEIAQLRQQEQAEYDAIAPNDEVAKKEIYDKYDEVITPLLEQEKELKAEEPQAPVAEEAAPLLPPVQFKAPELNLGTPKNLFDAELEKLGYSEGDIQGMTMEQKQEIVTNKTNAPIVESTAKVDSVKENKRQEKIAEAQAKLDEEATSEQAPQPFPAQEGAESVEDKFQANAELEQIYRDLNAAVTKNVDKDTIRMLKENPTEVMVEKALRELQKKGIINIEC